MKNQESDVTRTAIGILVVAALTVLYLVMIPRSTTPRAPAPPSPGKATQTSTARVRPTFTPEASVQTTPVLWPAPSNSQEFTDLESAQAKITPPVMLPVVVIEDLPLYTVWIHGYPDGSQGVRVIYSEPGGEQLDATLKSISIHWRRSTASISEEMIRLNFDFPQDIRAVSVRGQVGYTFWQPANAAGNSTWLIWNEGYRTYMISFSGDWPAPTEEDPHPMNDLMLLLVAESLNEP